MPGDQEKLNVYCWRQILKDVPIDRIVRAERVSKEWQAAILQYLQDIRIRIEGIRHYGWNDVYAYEETHGPDCRILHVTEGRTHAETGQLFEIITQKLGSSVVASYCRSEMTFSSIARNCPNMEHLALIGSEYATMGAEKDSLWLNETVDDHDFNRLKQISFSYINNTDDCIGKFLRSKVLEHLLIEINKNMTGRCLTEIRSDNLKSLSIISCKSLELQHLLSSINRLTTLTQLSLSDVSIDIFQKINLLLNAMPNLEALTLNRFVSDIDSDSVLNTEIAESIGRLVYLRHLNLNCNPTITDQVLEAVAGGCKQLQTLHVNGCSVTPRAIEDLCRVVGQPLEELNAAVPAMTEQHAENCIGFCPRLEVHWTALTYLGDADPRRPYAYMPRVLRGKDHPLRVTDTSPDENLLRDQLLAQPGGPYLRDTRFGYVVAGKDWDWEGQSDDNSDDDDDDDDDDDASSNSSN